MKKILLGLSLTLCLNAGWEDGSDLVKDMEEYKKGINGQKSLLFREGIWYGYVIGVRDILVDANYICVPQAVNGKQIFEIVRKYLEDNPGEWHKSASYLTSKPLLDTFPCKKIK